MSIDTHTHTHIHIHGYLGGAKHTAWKRATKKTCLELLEKHDLGHIKLEESAREKLLNIAGDKYAAPGTKVKKAKAKVKKPRLSNRDKLLVEIEKLTAMLAKGKV